MPTVKVSNYAFVEDGAFSLPGIRTTGNNTHIRSDQVYHFDLPADVRDRGVLSFIFDLDRGHDDGIDVAWEVSVNGDRIKSWAFRGGDEYAGVQLTVHNLRPGDNWVSFDMSKGGKVTQPNPDEYLGGKGKVNFSEVILSYHRDINV